MNTELLASKKFRTAVITALATLATFIASKFGFHLDKDEVQLLMTVVTAPFVMYILAEAVSETGAKKAIVENKAREELADKVLKEIIDTTDEKDNTNLPNGPRPN